MIIIIVILLPLSFLFTGCTSDVDRVDGTDSYNTFVSPYVKVENKQNGVNKYEPGSFFKPYVYIQIINPITKKKLIVSAYVDTGADHCYISKKLAEVMGLLQTDESPQKVFTASGEMEVYATEVEFQLADENKKIVKDFPIQKTHVYINDNTAYHVALGSIGFIDRFREIKFNYPHNMTFVW